MGVVAPPTSLDHMLTAETNDPGSSTELLRDLAAPLVQRTGRWLIQAGILCARDSMVRDAFTPHLLESSVITDGEWVVRVWEKRCATS